MPFRIHRFMTIGLLAMAIISPLAAHAQTYPTQPITMVVPFPAGGRTDLIGRVLAQTLSEKLGHPVVTVNRPGAGGVIGAKEVAQAKPDGYTLGFFSTAAVTSQFTSSTPVPLKAFDLIAIVNRDPAALAVHADAPWKTLADLVSEAKKSPDKLRIGTIPGASAQIFTGGFSRAAGVSLIEVPFKGDADGVLALAGGHIEAHMAVPIAYRALAEAKKIRMLGIAAEEKSALYGDLPTFRENGVDLVVGAFHGLFVPAGTPAPVLQKLADAMEATTKAPAVEAQMEKAGAAIYFLKGSPAQAFLAEQNTFYKSLIDTLSLQAATAAK